VPVLLHDDDVARVTDSEGPVRDFTFSALRALDAGYQFEAPDGSAPFRGAGLRIPSLAEALAALPGMRLNLELKEDRPEIAERVLAEIREAKREELTLVTAAEDGLMAKLRAAVERSGARGRARARARATSRVSCAQRATGSRLPPARWRSRSPTSSWAARSSRPSSSRRRTRTTSTCTCGRSTSPTRSPRCSRSAWTG
jgi:hypothetical protein